MTDMTLYQMTEEAKELASKLKEADVDDKTIQDTLESVGLDIGTKGGGYIAVFKELEHLANGFEAEEKRLAQCKKAVRNNMERLKNRLLVCAEELGLEKIETPLGNISVHKSPLALKINDEKAIPASFLTIIPEHTEPNKEAIKNALKNEQEVAGCELTQGTHLRIT